jgi:Spy/CpxP family protein refolding chaperone
MTDSKHCTKTCTPTQRRHRWFRRGAIGLFVLLGLGGVAYAAGPMHHGHHKPPASPDEARAHIGQVVGHALDRVDATAEQRARVDKVLDGAAPQMFSLHGEAHDLHVEVRDLLTADKIDRAALEEARKDLVSLVDRGSKILVGSLADTAEALTPEQRRKLADTAKRMHRE